MRKVAALLLLIAACAGASALRGPSYAPVPIADGWNPGTFTLSSEGEIDPKGAWRLMLSLPISEIEITGSRANVDAAVDFLRRAPSNSPIARLAQTRLLNGGLKFTGPDVSYASQAALRRLAVRPRKAGGELSRRTLFHPHPEHYLRLRRESIPEWMYAAQQERALGPYDPLVASSCEVDLALADGFPAGFSGGELGSTPRLASLPPLSTDLLDATALPDTTPVDEPDAILIGGAAGPLTAGVCRRLAADRGDHPDPAAYGLPTPARLEAVAAALDYVAESPDPSAQLVAEIYDVETPAALQALLPENGGPGPLASGTLSWSQTRSRWTAGRRAIIVLDSPVTRPSIYYVCLRGLAPLPPSAPQDGIAVAVSALGGADDRGGDPRLPMGVFVDPPDAVALTPPAGGGSTLRAIPFSDIAGIGGLDIHVFPLLALPEPCDQPLVGGPAERLTRDACGQHPAAPLDGGDVPGECLCGLGLAPVVIDSCRRPAECVVEWAYRAEPGQAWATATLPAGSAANMLLPATASGPVPSVFDNTQGGVSPATFEAVAPRINGSCEVAWLIDTGAAAQVVTVSPTRPCPD